MAADPTVASLGPHAEAAHAAAAEHGADQYIAPLADMTRRVFCDVRTVRLHLEDDPVTEDADDWRIVFRVEVACPAESAAKEIRTWYRELFDTCPAPKACLFSLALRVVD